MDKVHQLFGRIKIFLENLFTIYLHFFVALTHVVIHVQFYAILIKQSSILHNFDQIKFNFIQYGYIFLQFWSNFSIFAPKQHKIMQKKKILCNFGQITDIFFFQMT